MRQWDWRSEGNGATVTIYAPDGRTCCLQGEEALNFCDRIRRIGASYADDTTVFNDEQAALAEYDSVCG